MITWSQWESRRHRVAIVGTVVAACGRPLRRYELRLDEGPGANGSRRDWLPNNVSPRSIWTRLDGTFFVFDLKPGTYRLEARADQPVTGGALQSREPKAVKVVRHQRNRFDESHVCLQVEAASPG